MRGDLGSGQEYVEHTETVDPKTGNLHVVATPMLAVTLLDPPKGFSRSMDSLTCSASAVASKPERFGSSGA